MQSKRSFPPAQLEPNHLVGEVHQQLESKCSIRKRNSHEVHGLSATLPLQCVTAYSIGQKTFSVSLVLQKLIASIRIPLLVDEHGTLATSSSGPHFQPRA